MTVADLIHDAVDRGGFEAEDLRAVLGPLLREVAVIHEQGLVAPLRGLGSIRVADARRLSIAGVPPLPPTGNRAQLQHIQRPVSGAVDVVAHQRAVPDAVAGREVVATLDVIEPGQPVTHPLFVVGYETWEHQIGHHDAATDIESLGLLLASLALGFDFRVAGDLRQFVTNRRNPFAIRPELHPVIGRLIAEMAEPDRARRAQDVASLAERLHNYRDQPVDFDLALVAGAASGPIPRRRAAIQTALRDRLFEINRRNRLIYFAPTQQSVNLTVGSVPLQVDVRTLGPDDLATWRGPLAHDVVAGKHIKLNTVLRFEDAPYLPGALSKLASQARRDRAEYGVSQLHLVVCFLRWHNLKDDKDERINSPLLLLPVELTTKRGVRDSHVMRATTPVAEVNPALRHHLRQLYAIELPETVDLEEQSVDDLHALLQAQIEATEPGVVFEKVDRPQLELVQREARRRLDQYRRRQAAATAGGTEPSDALPVEDRRPQASPVADDDVAALPIEDRRPEVPPVADDDVAARVHDRPTYTVNEVAPSNPYRWQLDLCSLTLANLNYRKMTLVRDYAQLIATDEPSDAFDRIFSLDARPLDGDLDTILPLAEQHVVVPADETQRAAIAKARSGRSFIIQGPPGTGKSQTITNLVADYVARGKRVLFVCAKRAAVDVVHARLRKQGLDELCALIHDSQADKRAFIHGMRSTYEAWLAATDDPEATEAERRQIVDMMNERLGPLQRIDAAMADRPAGSDRDLRALFERGAQLRDAAGIECDATGPAQPTDLPGVADWYRDAPIVDAIAQTLSRLGEPRALALHPLADVRVELLTADRPGDAVAGAAAAAADAIGRLAGQLNAEDLDVASLTVADLSALRALAETAAELTPGALAVLTPTSSAAASLFDEATAMGDARAAAQHAAEGAAGWRDPLAAAEARAGLELAQAKERSLLRFVSGPWRALKKAVRARYEFARHAVRPTITTVLTELVAWQQADEQLRLLQAAASTAYGVPDLEPLRRRVEQVHAITAAAVAAVRDDPHRLGILIAGRADVGAALAAIDALFDPAAGATTRTIADVSARITHLRDASGAMRELVADLRRLHGASPAVVHAARTLPLTPEQLEVLVIDRAIDQFGLEHLDVERFTGRDLADHLEALHAHHRGLLDANAAVARGRARRRFRDHVAISAASAAQLTDDRAKEFKKAYAAGRRELEHEFQKTMRYKSIRDLVSGPAGPVVMDLRPVWLMSPLSVSDTLPLDPGQFDVVVFDEASQIPLEEAIPALYRAHQTIIVGDQMQLPPTTFFSTTRNGDDEVEVADEDDDRRVAVVLDGDSFLAQSAAALPSTMLAWHYRSRSEDLIGFSNAAFYGGALATVPDRHRPPLGLGPIVVDGSAGADAAVDAVLARSVSFHFVADGVYEARRNPAEAMYVAETVRALLRRGLGLTIGIAAFSEAQQAEIEDALDRLADEDDAFGDLLDADESREDDDQFVGLFVKNLENIQGDERDVIIISVCYGPGPDGRMRMNFGPINQQGGEKRLNVIFSRARQHMAIVSSIKAPQITNEHNDGANALRRFLDYAEALSEGDVERAQRVLDAANPLGRRGAELASHSTVIDGLGARLRSRGLVVEPHHGRSRFRCDLAVRRGDDADHRVAVLIDTRERSRLAPTDERALTHPTVLAGFGWTVVHVLTKDWYADPDAVVAAIAAAVR